MSKTNCSDVQLKPSMKLSAFVTLGKVERMAVGASDCFLYLIIMRKKICNLFPKTEFSIKQHSGNKLFSFALQVPLYGQSPCVQFIKGFWAAYREIFNEIHFCSRTKMGSMGECELLFTSWGVTIALWLGFFPRVWNIYRLNNMVLGISFQIIEGKQGEGDRDENTLTVSWSYWSCRWACIEVSGLYIIVFLLMYGFEIFNNRS